MKIPKIKRHKKFIEGGVDAFSQDILEQLLGVPSQTEQQDAQYARRKYAPHGKLERLSESLPWRDNINESSRKRVELALRRERKSPTVQSTRKAGTLSRDEILVLQDIIYRSTNNNYTEGDD